MSSAKPLRLAPDADGIARAAALLRAGQLVAFPTETVYGLGADATNGEAVAAIYAAKGRPSFNPLIAHVAAASQADTFCEVPEVARPLIDAFWPGPLTLVLPLREGVPVSGLVTAGLKTLAIRVPAHPVAQALLSAVGGPVAAPSANPSGRISPTRPEHVIAGLGDRVDAIVDGGACTVGVESTIIGFEDGTPVILREGGVSAEALADELGEMPARSDATSTTQPTAPGQLASHYAPKGAVRLNADASRVGEVMLGFGPVQGDMTLSADGDLAEAAANLFERLHQLDAMDADRIAVAPIPDHGLGAAINDRLRRAAAPRD